MRVQLVCVCLRSSCFQSLCAIACVHLLAFFSHPLSVCYRCFRHCVLLFCGKCSSCALARVPTARGKCVPSLSWHARWCHGSSGVQNIPHIHFKLACYILLLLFWHARYCTPLYKRNTLLFKPANFNTKNVDILKCFICSCTLCVSTAYCV